jgi:hypothetical protein
MTRLVKLTLASLSLTAVACRPVDDEAEEFRNAIPRQETVQMTIPKAAGQALTVETQQQALKGDIADFYKLTRDVSGLVNGGGAWVLLLVKTVVSFPPTSIGTDQAVWGPWPDDKAAIIWRVTVNRVGEHKYSYVFEGQDKATPNGPFVKVLSGTHTAAVDEDGMPVEGHGVGDFTLDWDARNTLPPEMRGDGFPKQADVGKATYKYSRMSATSAIEVDALFRQVRDDERPNQRVDVDYVYRATPGAGGSMQFVHAAPMTMQGAGARWAVNSRWDKTGAGRSDVRAKGGDLAPGLVVTANECWDTRFTSQYLAVSWAQGGYGNESTDCVFKTAEYSNLSF